jgi:hypothetical protein
MPLVPASKSLNLILPRVDLSEAETGLAAEQMLSR